MKAIIEFIKSTALGGFLGALPIVVFVLVIGEAVEIVEAVIDPVAELLGVVEIGGVDITGFAAVVVLIGFCSFFGFVFRTNLGSRVGQWLNRSIMDRIPGFKMIRTVTGRLSGRMEGTLLSPALVTLPNELRALAFIVEEFDDGQLLVFVPSAPTPTIGSVYQVEAEKVRRLEASGAKVFDCLMRWGLGSKDLIPPEPAKATE